MARYFFEITRGSEAPRRGEALEFSSTHEAWCEALTSSGEIIRDLDGKFDPGTPWRMLVVDQHGKSVYSLSFVTEKIG